ncbi:hypothetical protein D9M68_356930 [compost metagenome]
MTGIATIAPSGAGLVRCGSGSAQAASTPILQFLRFRQDLRQDPSVLALQPTKSALTRLQQLNDNWDGFGSARPNVAAIYRAQHMLPELFSAAGGVRGWIDPHVSASEAGEVTFEWWRGDKTITLFFNAAGIDYLRAWGSSMDDEMDDGELQDNQFRDLWLWFNS